MNDIELKKKDQENAVYDYLRAQESQIKLLNASPTLFDNLEQYDTNVSRLIEDEKSSVFCNFVGDDKTKEESRKLYFNCIKAPHEQINGVSNTEKYYRNGRIHHVVETSEFEWKYREEDL